MSIMFFKKAVPATFNADLELAGYTSETVFHEPIGAGLALLEAFTTDLITAGSLVVNLKKNGIQIATVTLQSGTPRATVSPSEGLNPGDRVTVTAVATTLAPITADLLVVIR